ncbi:MAG: glycosyltransferase family 4 protein [Thermoanaerobaculia bacterium]
MRTAVFSIVSPNYRHYARTLMASVKHHQPEWERFVLVIGGAAAPGEEFTTVSLDTLTLPSPRQFCFRYTLLELNTAVKPWMFGHLFALGFDRVVFIDPDIQLYGPLVEIEEPPADTLLMLTPHLTGFISGDDFPSERWMLIAGAYNLGFLAVTRQPQLDAFVSWWKRKLEYQCLVDTANGLYVDQKWMDLAPGLFPGVVVLRHDGYNVAYWNLEQRRVTVTDEGVTVNGQPLRFLHFSGFDPDLRLRVSRHHHALMLADIGRVRELYESYRTALRAAGQESFRHAPYPFAAFADGTPISDAARAAYRQSPQRQAACGANPFAHPELFKGLRDAPKRPPLAARAGVASYRFFSRARPLVLLLPKGARTAIREVLLGRREPRIAAASASGAGVNLVGYLSRSSGVGESARGFQRACAAAGIPLQSIDIDAPHETAAGHGISIFHVNADQIAVERERLRRAPGASADDIGVWHWELPELPAHLAAAAAPLREIWAPSAYIQDAIGRAVSVPVVHMPHGVSIGELVSCTPQELGVPSGRFTFLCLFDLASVVDRKNPLGAVEAFRRAFDASSTASLLVKAGGAEGHAAEYAELERQLRGIPNVHLTSRMLPRAQLNGLLASSDALVSLHRSEGFGLVLAEAMALGKPVVATGWSGNMDFMNAENSCPVNYELVPLERSYGNYAAGSRWAEPDVAHAASLMRRVVEEAEFRKRVGALAAETIHSRFSPEAAGLRYFRRLSLLGLLPGGDAR